MLSDSEQSLRHELLKMKKLVECPICLQLMTNPMVTRCVHRFCGECINKAIDNSSTPDYCRCPLCNEKITKRSLRPQIDFADIISAFRDAVDSFEKDFHEEVITNTDEVVIFDLSTDRSKSRLQTTNDCTIASVVVQPKDNEKVKRKSNELVDSVNGNDWPTPQDTTQESDNNKTVEITADSEPSKVSDVDKTNEETIELTNDENSVTNVNPSQNLTVNRSSKITYGVQKQSDDKFDRIMGLSAKSKITGNTNKDKRAKPKPRLEYKSSSESDVDSIDGAFKSKTSKHLKEKNDKEIKKKNYKRVNPLEDSSDDDLDSPVFAKDRKQRNFNIRESDIIPTESTRKSALISKDLDDDFSDDLDDEDILPALNSKKAVEVIKK
ncbi:breast cancer type 1 susceptibility protein homolog [Oppia nitens]|uniref:breast cancer type 1 susceptibility protein homolog n=1 Tax=Oppia nitens TaxID=1686743 RepID=UPI0023DA4D93|nr:breast cancer type 1 susceptibility protein homolog [Oppia nitens]XP_054166420.1 breast cancer type 1 susceptibility protein homolog [Oppia nitens]